LLLLHGIRGRALGRGHTPTRVHTVAQATLEKVGDGFGITTIHLRTEAQVPGIDEAAFRQQAEQAKANCPVSKALTGVRITLDAKLV
jgi:osmotically inducible protein OsmC